MTKEKDAQVVVRNFTEKGGFMIVPHLALFEFGGDKANLLFALIARFQYFYLENKLSQRGGFCCTQEELEERTGIKPRKQTNIIKELQEEGLISTYYSNIGLRRLKWFYFTKGNFTNISKRLDEAWENLNKKKAQAEMAGVKNDADIITSQVNFSFLREHSAQ